MYEYEKWILMLLALVLCGVTQAQNAEVTLNNGTIVKGDIKKFSFNVDNYHEFRIKKLMVRRQTSHLLM